MISMVTDAIERANRILPGAAAPDGEIDPRWQAIIAVAEYLESDPEPVWEFVMQWGVYPDSDLQAGIATCILEHLLEHHFDLVFPRVAELARVNPNFANTVRFCWSFGQAEAPRSQRALKALLAELNTHAG
jgi:hypothetical protein